MPENTGKTGDAESKVSRTLPEALRKLHLLIMQAREALLIPSTPCTDAEERETGTLSGELSMHIETLRGLQDKVAGIVEATEQLRDKIVE